MVEDWGGGIKVKRWKSMDAKAEKRGGGWGGGGGSVKKKKDKKKEKRKTQRVK